MTMDIRLDETSDIPFRKRIVALDGSTVAGHVVFDETPEQIVVHLVEVDPAYRNSGVMLQMGCSFVDYVEPWLYPPDPYRIENGMFIVCDRLFVYVDDTTAPLAEQLYSLLASRAWKNGARTRSIPPPL